MAKKMNTPQSIKDSRKSNPFVTQEQLVFKELKKRPATMFMADQQTGVERANICRIIAKWKKRGKVHLYKTDLCKITRYKAGYYTTDTNLFSSQLNLF